MSDRVQNGEPGESVNGQRMTQRRRQAWAGALAGLAVAGVLIGMLVAMDGSDDGGDTASAQAAAETTAEPAPAASAPATAGPTATAAPDQGAASQNAASLPPGADAALSQKPAPQAGTGELTKLTVTPLVKGKGAAVKSGQSITVNYVGVLYRTGEEFDASWNGSGPVSFQIGVGQVIPGWDRGLIGVKVGSRVVLDIPAELAYGENPTGGQPPGPLRFVVDILAVQ